MLTQFDRASTLPFSAVDFIIGFRMIIWGLFKKVIIADYCAMLVDPVYGDVGAYNSWSYLIATYAFTLQIYCDFSAYSEIAKGSARMFGIDLMDNFDQPYLVADVSSFWRRWHISLSTWIRDYLFIPLGGSRKGNARTLLNVIIVMFLSGLWHGAAWNYVMWGLFHGALLVIHAVLSKQPKIQALATRVGRLYPFICWLLTFHLVVFGWVLFRVNSLSDFVPISLGMIKALVFMELPTMPQLHLIAILIAFLTLSYADRRIRIIQKINADTGQSILFYGSLIVAMLLLASGQATRFIYFQF